LRVTRVARRERRAGCHESIKTCYIPGRGIGISRTNNRTHKGGGSIGVPDVATRRSPSPDLGGTSRRCVARPEGVLIDMGMGMRVTVLQVHVGDDLDAPVLDSAHRQDLVRDRLQPIGPAANHDHLQAVVVAQVNVHGRPNAIAHLMLQLGQLLTEIANVVVIDDGQRRDCIHAGSDLRADDLGARQIPKHLGTRATALDHQSIQIGQKGGIDGDSKSNQGRRHGMKIRHRAGVRPWGSNRRRDIRVTRRGRRGLLGVQ
jgi:hypothetical protein